MAHVSFWQQKLFLSVNNENSSCCCCFMQIARLLLALEEGRLHEFKGKSLESINAEGMFYVGYHCRRHHHYHHQEI